MSSRGQNHASELLYLQKCAPDHPTKVRCRTECHHRPAYRGDKGNRDLVRRNTKPRQRRTDETQGE